MSAVDREKRSKALLGRPRSEATKAKIRVKAIGRKHSDATKAKISSLQKGRPASPGTLSNLVKMAAERVGKKRPAFSEEWCQNLSKANKGRAARNKGISASLEEAARLRTLTIGAIPWNKGKTGLGGYTWAKGAKTPENLRQRMSVAYKEWRTSVFERDDYTCQHCGIRGVELNADHIKPFSSHPELRLDLSNGRTLCVPCHRATDTYGLKMRMVAKPQPSAGEGGVIERSNP